MSISIKLFFAFRELLEIQASLQKAIPDSLLCSNSSSVADESIGFLTLCLNLPFKVFFGPKILLA